MTDEPLDELDSSGAPEEYQNAPEPDLDAGLLAALNSVTGQLAAAERLADAIRGYRDRLVIQLAENSRPYGDIAAASDMSPQGISKITRAAGLNRYRPRDADG